MFSLFSKLKARVDTFLNEKNFVTDILNKIEEKTGIKKRLLVIGKAAVCLKSQSWIKVKVILLQNDIFRWVERDRRQVELS